MFNLAQFLAQSVTGVGVLGAVVGGSAKLADVSNQHRKQDKKEIDWKSGSYAVSKEASGAGVATAFSAFSAGVVGGGLTVSLITAFTAATVGKYAWDYGVEALELKFAPEKKKGSRAPIKGR